ncbi:MAG TPA: GNAT family N-acetyltransferase [Verrucomicrobiae bacterium]|nr:GNAT family N-acetyltransferase [Verrucomicrobiae bacterium]
MIAENAISEPVGSSASGIAARRVGADFVCLAPQPVNPSDCSDWDALVAAHPQGSIFHTTAWAKTLQQSYDFKPVYFMAGEAGGRSSMLPLMEVDSWLTGRRGVALPYTDDCEPLYSDAGAMRSLTEASLKFGRARKWKSVEWRGGRGLFNGAPAALAYYGHALDLDPDEGRMFSRLDSSVRRAVRKAEKSGVTVNISQSLQAMKSFYALHCQTRRKHGLPPQPFSFFQNIFEHLLSKKLGMIAIASRREQPVAASVYFQLGARAVYKYGASDEAFQHLRGANLVMWEAIKWHARHGATVLHFGRTSLNNEGLRRFKLGWGAAEQRIEYVKYDLRKERFVTGTDEATGWHNGIFRRLPLRMSRLIGAALYRHCA